MARKILVGMFAVFVVIALASAGYTFGRHLAKSDAAPAKSEAAPRAT